ncbi:MAG: hypothetical protein Ta2D_05680 [Rickettsiales bacterium]|nr:MAG: hypothetical protein Ta2D_05680 [Rickettsiales bacterium]
MVKMRGYENFNEIYAENIKYSVGNDSFFKDGWDYFFVGYIRPIIDRTFFIFIGLIGAFISYYVINLVFLILPIREDVFITIREKDIANYNINIKDLTKNKEAITTDEHILKYLLESYVKEREQHNYMSGNISDLNKKLTRVHNNSAPNVDQEFKVFMSRENINGPFQYFGKNIESKINITNFKFKRIVKPKLVDRIKSYFTENLSPVSANVYYTLTIQTESQKVQEKRRAYIEFKYQAIDKNKKGEYTAPKIVVSKYQNFKLK